MWTNDVALVFGQQEPFRSFAGVDVEMIEPEIGENFFELALAVNSAKNLLLAQFDEHTVGRHLDHPLRGSRFVARFLSLPPRLEQRLFIFLSQLPRTHRQRHQRLQALARRRIVYSFRMQLLVDVAIDADSADPLDVTCSRAEGNPVQCVGKLCDVSRAGCGGCGQCGDERHSERFHEPSPVH